MTDSPVGAANAAPTAVTVFVCTSCRRAVESDQGGETFVRPGGDLVPALTSHFADVGAPAVTVTAVDCLAVCKRPCTIAVVADGKWTYLVGDLDTATHVDEIVSAVLAYQRSDNGIVPWKERPASFRKGVVARIPPLGFIPTPVLPMSPDPVPQSPVPEAS